MRRGDDCAGRWVNVVGRFRRFASKFDASSIKIDGIATIIYDAAALQGVVGVDTTIN